MKNEYIKVIQQIEQMIEKQTDIELKIKLETVKEILIMHCNKL